MKTLLKLSLSFVIILMLTPSIAFSQVDYSDARYSKYGKEVANREANMKNFSFFIEAYKMGNTEDAIKRLGELIVACPAASENLYIIGLKLHRAVLDNAETAETKKEALKQIINIYDLRAANFPTKKGVNVSYCILGDKVKELMRHDFMWEDQSELFKHVNGVIKVSGANLDLSCAIVYFKAITDRFMLDEVSADIVLQEFEMLSNAIELSSNELKVEAQRTLGGLLIQSGAADCDNLETLFKPQYEADPNNIALIQKIMRYLNANECNGAFKTILAEKYYNLDPSADAAYSLATTFAAERNYPKAIQYYREAVASETDRGKRSIYEFRLSGMYLMNKNNELAATYAKRAISSDPRNGLAYFILSQAYAIGSTQISCGAFEKKTVYWLLYTVLQKAKTLIEPSSPQSREVNRLLAVYKQHFPNMEDIFFKELKVGDPFNVECGWIKGTTKVYSPN